MKVNAAFYRWVKKGKKKVMENKNVTGIEIPGVEWGEENTSAMFRILMKHAPEGEGWCICGWALVKPKNKIKKRRL